MVKAEYFMNKKLKLLISTVGLFLCQNSMAGIGVSLSNGEYPIPVSVGSPKILVPIKLSDSLVIEPYFSQSKYSISENNFGYIEKTLVYGIGAMVTTFKQNSISGYTGIRLGKFKSKTNFDSGSETTLNATQGSLFFGVAYMPTTNYEISFELGYSANKGDETSQSSFTTTDIDVKQTFSGVNMRYYF